MCKGKQNDISVTLHKMKCPESGSNKNERIHKFENDVWRAALNGHKHSDRGRKFPKADVPS